MYVYTYTYITTMIRKMQVEQIQSIEIVWVCPIVKLNLFINSFRNFDELFAMECNRRTM